MLPPTLAYTTANPMQWTHRPTWLEIDLAALRHNLRQARTATGPQVAHFPVIKADGYGIGAIAVAHTLEEEADGFCVALVEEAEQLRTAGINKRIMLFSGLYPGLEERAIRARVEPFLSDEINLNALWQAAKCYGPISVHIKIDSGMARLGYHPEHVPSLLDQLAHMPELKLAGLVSHMACADDRHSPITNAQLATLSPILEHPLVKQTQAQLSLANSATILGHPNAHYQWVRPGIMIYGASPFFPHTNAANEGLQPVVRWVTHIQRIHTLEKGKSLGYGHTFTATRPTRIAQLPVGYADGYNRLWSNKGSVLIAGQHCPVVGIVCMDQIAVDISDLQGEVKQWDEAVLLGKQHNAEITLENWATELKTIPYEILTRIGPRVPRRYRDGSILSGSFG
ncbi:alanine racemase [Magnetococcus marinus MC-1]|uniref:Alanine racemase n=1 Tax=Magnetococcus marinus (strain ATCC BAA-1437 / JCM 17883 / MC-1) TaxID=156889 RepID=A0L493_MAGMM|nr:alanine racemase [Magnetococcus marinus]ABK42786.1 alanine racemase [Magnetococcus marinus MC-1]